MTLLAGIKYLETLEQTQDERTVSDCGIVIPFQFGWEVNVRSDGSVTITRLTDSAHEVTTAALLQAEQADISAALNSIEGEAVPLPTCRPCIEQVEFEFPGRACTESSRWDWQDTSIPKRIYRLRAVMRSLRMRITGSNPE